MARRKKPVVKGSDPAYAHQFESYRPVETNMPPDVVIPNADQPQSETTQEDQAAPKTPKPKPKSETPSARAAEARKPTPQKRKAEPSTKTDKEIEQGATRMLNLDAAPTHEHIKAMEPLIDKGLERRDILALAGRRATSQFDPVAKFVPRPEGDRIPMREAYRTSKPVSAALLDKLREEHDPLRVKSDAAMVRGQFETLFWSTLDDVIKELNDKFA